MSDIMRDFTENELKIFKCFINPKYPACIRSLSAVCKETGLKSDEVKKVYEAYDHVLFSHIENTKWMFNLMFFAKKFHKKYLDLFEKYLVINSHIGMIVVPKDISNEVLSQIVEKVKESVDSESIKSIEHLMELIELIEKRMDEKVTDSLGQSIKVFSFSA